MVVTKEVARYTNKAVDHLLRAGFDSVNLYAPRGVCLSDGEEVIRHRCSESATEAGLFLEAMASYGVRGLGQPEFVLYARADLVLWKYSRLVLEETIEPNFMGLYFPLSPEPFFGDSPLTLPCSRGLGWCEAVIKDPVQGAACLSMNKHTAMLMAFAANKHRKNFESLQDWQFCLSKLIRECDLPCFVHLPSMGKLRTLRCQTTSIPVEAELKQGWRKKNWYLN